MTEIQFLAQLLLNDSLSAEVKKQLVNRIVEVEQQKTSAPPSINIPFYGPQPTFPIGSTPIITYTPYVYNPGPSSQSVGGTDITVSTGMHSYVDSFGNRVDINTTTSDSSPILNFT